MMANVNDHHHRLALGGIEDGLRTRAEQVMRADSSDDIQCADEDSFIRGVTDLVNGTVYETGPLTATFDIGAADVGNPLVRKREWNLSCMIANPLQQTRAVSLLREFYIAHEGMPRREAARQANMQAASVIRDWTKTGPQCRA